MSLWNERPKRSWQNPDTGKRYKIEQSKIHTCIMREENDFETAEMWAKRYAKGNFPTRLRDSVTGACIYYGSRGQVLDAPEADDHAAYYPER